MMIEMIDEMIDLLHKTRVCCTVVEALIMDLAHVYTCMDEIKNNNNNNNNGINEISNNRTVIIY